MISVVVFDVGGVLLQLDFPGMIQRLSEVSNLPFEVVQDFFLPERGPGGEPARTLFGRATVGLLSADQVLRELSEGTGVGEARLRQIYSTLLPGRIEPVVQLMSALSAKIRVGVLSNTNALAWNDAAALLPELGLVEQIVLSYEVKLVKPDRRLYQLLSERFGCAPSTICFIDDAIENVDAARDYGLNAIHFQSVEQLASELAQLGVGTSNVMGDVS